MVDRTLRPPRGGSRAPRGATFAIALAGLACACSSEPVAEADAWVPPPPVDWCNGVDDDGDGMTDEGATPGEPCSPSYLCSDPAACRCAPTHVLCEGACYERPVRARTATCDGACTFIDTNADHCGACGNRCAEGLRCWEGRCVCPELTCNGACTPYSAQDCGACGRACPSGAICYPESPVPCQCPRPSLPCGPGGACVGYSDENCGGCGYRCPPGSYCQGHSCAWR